ncbi:hypothetical protein [Couchioplanes caeruleus]|uniref:Uncharacterized protein n=2 Tax=Couchioplanes caeruleus TaxID=56438 RepID=A0A1K0GNS4_9ACTN|nr:hypothetical protein [Couchioplanes caeruleus]OJF10851.1 hypothetical protein BG844_29685 [Couchioplanes caeruleus subsp. caeruleus]ROP32811.1 hypothetical protein EDD30_5759 [Couchioplanes caeruleus]
MDVISVSIEGDREALALHRFLFEAKLEHPGSIYAGSPYIASIQRRLADALEAADPGSGWARWRLAEGHEERVGIVRRHLSTAGPWWNDLNRAERETYVRDILAPLNLSADLLAEVTATHGDSLPRDDAAAP